MPDVLFDELAEFLAVFIAFQEQRCPLDIGLVVGGVDDAIGGKLASNAAKYPVEASRGVSTKYDQLPEP